MSTKQHIRSPILHPVLWPLSVSFGRISRESSGIGGIIHPVLICPHQSVSPYNRYNRYSRYGRDAASRIEFTVDLSPHAHHLPLSASLFFPGALFLSVFQVASLEISLFAFLQIHSSRLFTSLPDLALESFLPFGVPISQSLAHIPGVYGVHSNGTLSPCVDLTTPHPPLSVQHPIHRDQPYRSSS